MAVVSAICEFQTDKPSRKASLDSTVAPSLSPSSTRSYSRADTFEDDDSEPCYANEAADGVQEDSDIDEVDAGIGDDVHCMACMSSDPVQRPMVSPGMCIRVWRWTSASSRMEWAEVIQRRIVDGTERFLCETILFEPFEFSPQLVAERRDDAVEMYDVSPEDMQKAGLRQQEVARLHSALTSQGVLEKLPAAPAYRYPGFIVAPSQFHVKCTVLGSDVRDRRDLQETVQRGILHKLARCTRLKAARRPAHAAYLGAAEQPTATGSKDSGSAWQRWLRNVKSQFCSRSVAEETVALQRQDCPDDLLDSAGNLLETPSKHRPDDCYECICKGTWCGGALHLPVATACLDAAVSSTHGRVHWRPSEAGVEAEIVHQDEHMLLQVRPSLFCIPDTDVRLFGSTRHSLDARRLQ